MTSSITHSFVSAKADGTDATVVRPSNWNADHVAQFQSALTGGQLRTLDSKISDIVSIFDFIPSSMISDIKAYGFGNDVTGYIQSAINAMIAAKGGILFFPQGGYLTTSQLNINAANSVQLVGCGSNAGAVTGGNSGGFGFDGTVIDYFTAAPTTDAVISMNNCRNCGVSGMYIEGSDKAQNCLRLVNVQYGVFDDLTTGAVNGANGSISIESDAGATTYSARNEFRSLKIVAQATGNNGIEMGLTSTAGVTNNVFTGTVIQATDKCIRIRIADNNRFTHVSMLGSTNEVLELITGGLGFTSFPSMNVFDQAFMDSPGASTTKVTGTGVSTSFGQMFPNYIYDTSAPGTVGLPNVGTCRGYTAEGLMFGSWYPTSAAVVVTSLLPAATAGAGARAFVTNANSTVFNSIVAGGGANTVPVVSDGTNWRIG